MTIYCRDGNVRSNVTRVQHCVTPGTLSTLVKARLEIHTIAFVSALISSLMSSNKLSKRVSSSGI
jgi:hypothetical protein